MMIGSSSIPFSVGKQFQHIPQNKLEVIVAGHHLVKAELFLKDIKGTKTIDDYLLNR